MNNSLHTISNISATMQGFKDQIVGSLGFGGSNAKVFPVTGYTGGEFTVAVSYVPK